MGTMPRLRVSAISFLNTAPLMWDFDHGDLRQHFRVDYTVPSACAELLRTGMADIGIIPAATYATIPDLVVIPDVAIAARGPVRSIYLISKVPVTQIKTVAADTSSRSSVALLRVLFAKFYEAAPEFVPMPPDLHAMLRSSDAALLIGDPALLAYASLPRDRYHVHDLAEDWQKFTGKNFVFAFWAVRKAAQAGAAVAHAFQDSRDHGVQPENIARIAREWTNRIALSETEICSYLTEAIHYRLDPPSLEGLCLFYKYAAECGALPHAPELRFLS
jgi:chorismate dehydratase